METKYILISLQGKVVLIHSEIRKFESQDKNKRNQEKCFEAWGYSRRTDSGASDEISLP